MLKKEKQELEKLVKRAKERMRTAPQGNIRVRKWRNVVEYYYVEQNKKPTDNGRYMKKNEIGLVRKIVQRDYDEEYAKRWQELEYTGKAFADDAPEIITERGERVRSKSEKIIADKLYMLGIPYRYEYPLVLEGNITIYPDFAILRMPQREEVYLEHFGMMDDEDYVENVLMKLNIKALDALIKSLFCVGE